MTTRPEITSSVDRSLDLAIRALGEERKTRALLHADLLAGAGFDRAARRIRNLAEELPDDEIGDI